MKQYTAEDYLKEAMRQTTAPAISLPARGPTTPGVKWLSKIQGEAVSWLWEGFIAHKKLTILAGDPGVGKSQITASIAAIVSRGGQWPGCRFYAEAGSVLLMSAEDDLADTIRPRLEAAGADLDRVCVPDITESFDLETGIDTLRALLVSNPEIRLCIIDPIMAYLGPNTDSHKTADVRRLLAPLSALAAERQVAMLAVSHLNKSSGRAMASVTGSMAFVAAARAAFLVAKDPDDDRYRCMVPVKNNIALDKGGLKFSIEGATIPTSKGDIQTSRISWSGERVTRTADDLLRAGSGGGCGGSAIDEAKAWLGECLANGPVLQVDVLDKGESDGFSEKTLRRAKKDLGIKSVKLGKAAGWAWELPKMAKTPEDGQHKTVAAFGEVGHLRHEGAVTVEEL